MFLYSSRYLARQQHNIAIHASTWQILTTRRARFTSCNVTRILIRRQNLSPCRAANIVFRARKKDWNIIFKVAETVMERLCTELHMCSQFDSSLRSLHSHFNCEGKILTFKTFSPNSQSSFSSSERRRMAMELVWFPWGNTVELGPRSWCLVTVLILPSLVLQSCSSDVSHVVCVYFTWCHEYLRISSLNLAIDLYRRLKAHR